MPWRARDTWAILVILAVVVALGKAFTYLPRSAEPGPVWVPRWEPDPEPKRRYFHGPLRPGETLGWIELEPEAK